MGYPTKVQLIKRKKTADQYYINLPTAIAEAMEFEKGETVEWIIEDKANLVVHRKCVPPSPMAMKKRCAAPRGHRTVVRTGRADDEAQPMPNG